METKNCRACKIDQPISLFSPEKRNKDKLKSYCKPCMVIKSQIYNNDHLEERNIYAKKFREEHKEEARERSKIYYQETIEERRAYGRKYRKKYLREHPEKVLALANAASKRRRLTDPMFRVVCNLRRRLNHLLSGSKSLTTMQLVGCDTDTLRKHLEAQWLEGMNWDNYALKGWHVDHIIPLQFEGIDLFNEEHLKIVCHYSNLRPMWGSENSSRSNKMSEQELEASIKRLAITKIEQP